MTRTFEAKPARRIRVPLWIGLSGAAGSGKTFSALRLAKGIQSVYGGEIYFIDTESGRGLHYAEDFSFTHVPFDEPYSPKDYGEVIDFCLTKNPSVIIVDSMSHEHEGEGGVLDMHEIELDRMAGSDFRKREACNIGAWKLPKRERNKLVQRLKKVGNKTVFIFCFRAKEKIKMGKRNRGEEAIVDLGFVPIAGDDYTFEMTVFCNLPPSSEGKPDWTSTLKGEHFIRKLPGQFKDILTRPGSLTEETGRVMAEWARGPVESPNCQPSNFPTQPAPTNRAKELQAKLLDLGESKGNVKALFTAAGNDPDKFSILAEQRIMALEAVKESFDQPPQEATDARV